MRLPGTHAQWVLIDACLRLAVPFFWQTAGTMLISPVGVADVIRDVVASGHAVLGCEGFELDGHLTHPRLDCIYDAERWPAVTDPTEVLRHWPRDVWVDVVLADTLG